MIFLTLVNNVLKRLREDEVTTVSQNSYSKLVGTFVNDAKQFVEDAWDWSALRTTINVKTIEDIFNYSFTGVGNDIKILHAYNDTENWDLKYQSPIWFDKRYMFSEPERGSPRYFVFNGTNEDGDTKIDVYPKPNKDGDILRFNVIRRRPELVQDNDKLLIPAMPVVNMALAFTARERGETGGTSTAEYFAIADKMLSDAIAGDAQKHPEETIWYTP